MYDGMNITKETNIAVLGLGNILLTDEGVGVHAVNAISKRCVFSPPLEIVDGGTMGLDLLPLFQEKDKILIIDAVDFGKAAGLIGIIEGDAIPSALKTVRSSHWAVRRSVCRQVDANDSPGRMPDRHTAEIPRSRS